MSDPIIVSHGPKTFLAPPQASFGHLIDEPFAQYQAHDAINASGIKTLLRSPSHYYYERYYAPERDTQALRWGRLVHSLVLEPWTRANLEIVPKFDRRTAAGKADEAAYKKALGERAIVVTQDEHDALMAMTDSVLAHPIARKLLHGGVSERSLYWHDPDHDIVCKARFDYVTKEGLLVDLKTTTNACPDAFARDFLKYQYGISAAHYLEGARMTQAAQSGNFILIALEKEPPYGLRIYDLIGAWGHDLDRFFARRQEALRQYAQSRHNASWPGYSAQVEQLLLPQWG